MSEPMSPGVKPPAPATRTSLRSAFRGKTALVTGHTGFKGSWLSMWLHHLGARVVGYAPYPPTTPSLYEEVGSSRFVTHIGGDVVDADGIERAMSQHRPDFVFHLAAQPLVKASYVEPRQTFHTNVMGCVNVLDAVRRLNHPCSVVVVTSDKCYLDQSWIYGYRENDRLGGPSDPYSASKAAQEIVTDSYRKSFFAGSVIRLGSARAGNVVGGGDWAANRLVPDAIRALSAGQEIVVRNPTAIRPWQHVLQALSGYLLLAARMAEADGARLAQAWNFGPEPGAYSVGEVVDMVVRAWGSGSWRREAEANAPAEVGLLALSVDKARALLGWRPLWNVEDTIRQTVAWHKGLIERRGNVEAVHQLSLRTIEDFEGAIEDAKLSWCA